MSYDFCLVEKKDHIVQITINRPEVYNALHPPANDELDKIFNDYANDKDSWVAILTGAGDKAFCSGNDLKYQASGKKMWIPDTGMAGITGRYDLDKPIIAAVNGLALGGGMEIAMACDIIVASEHAKFGLPEGKVGMFPGGGGIQMLRQQVGRKVAADILYTARQLSAQEAKGLGIVNRVVQSDKLLGEAYAIASQICECSPSAIRTTKRILNRLDVDAGYAEGMKYNIPEMVQLTQTEDFQEGLSAFSQKRKPEWKNR